MIQQPYSHVCKGVGYEVKEGLTEQMRRIERAVGQLDEAGVWARPGEGMRSVGELMLHLRAYVGELLVKEVGGRGFESGSEAEQVVAGKYGGDELVAMLWEVVSQSDLILKCVTKQMMLEEREVRGKGSCVLAVVMDVYGHFYAHTQEIVHVVRAQLGTDYVIAQGGEVSVGEEGA